MRPRKKVIRYPLVLDNNVLGEVTAPGKEQLMLALDRIVRDQGEVRRPSSFRYLLSPFLFLEHLGIANIPYPRLSAKISEANLETSTGNLLDAAYKHFSGLPQLQPKTLKEMFRRQSQFKSDRGRLFWEEIVGKPLRAGDDFADPIYWQLAIDYVQGLGSSQFTNESARRSFYASILRDSLETFESRINVAHTRGIFEGLEHFGRKNQKDPRLDSVKEYLFPTSGLSKIADRGDLALVHSAVVGGFLGDKLFPALAITADPLESVKKRLIAYKLGVEAIPSVLHEIQDSRLRHLVNRFRPKPGKVVVVRRPSFEVSAVIEVKSLLEEI